MAAGLKSHAVHRAIHFRNPEDLRNLIADRGIFRDIHGFAAEAPGLRQPLGDQVAVIPGPTPALTAPW